MFNIKPNANIKKRREQERERGGKGKRYDGRVEDRMTMSLPV